MNRKKGPSGRARHRGKRRGGRPPRRDGGKKPEGFEHIERAYLNLLQEHLQARKRYFEFFHRADPKRLAKLERVFSESARKMQEFAAEVAPKWRERFDNKFNPHKNDTAYSDNMEAPGQWAPPKDVEDPHLLTSQVDADYREDREESVGTMEDYQAYKGA